MRRNDVNVLRAFYDKREAAFDKKSITSLENTKVSTQNVVVHLRSDLAPGTSTTRKRSGGRAVGAFNVTPTYFDLINEDVEVSWVNNTLSQYGSEEAVAKIREAYLDDLQTHVMRAIRNIYTRGDKQFTAFLETNKWALGTQADNGSLYTGAAIVSDTKEVPQADAQKFFQNIEIEANENNFALGAFRPSLIGSTASMQVVNDYLARGNANQTNIKQFLNYFDPYFTNEISNAAADDATMFLTHGAGIAGYSRAARWDLHPDAQNGVVKTAEDTWTTLNVGGADSATFSNVPSIRIEVKGFKGFQDNSGTLTNQDEAKIDITESLQLIAQFGAFAVTDQSNASIKPIIKYVLKS